MSKLELFDGRVTSLEVLDGVKHLWVLTQRPGDGAQAPDMLRMSPTGIVSTAVAVRDDRARIARDAYSTGRRRRSEMRKIEPFFAPVDEIDAFSSRISQPCSLTTY